MNRPSLIDRLTTRLAIMTISKFPYNESTGRKKCSKSRYYVVRGSGKARLKRIDVKQPLVIRSIFPNKEIENKMVITLKENLNR